MMPGGSWAPIFGMLTGTGRGAGMALMYVLFGAGALLLSIGSFAVKEIRDVETLLPDYAPAEEPAQHVPPVEHVPVETIDEN
jgi:hypothetical protein